MIVISLMAEDAQGNKPDIADLQAWVDQYQLTFPVLADPGWKISGEYEQDGYIPTVTVLDHGLVVRGMDVSNWKRDAKDSIEAAQ